MRTLLILPLILLILGGCAAQSTRTDDGLYRAAMQAYDDQNWQAAAEQLAVLESANGGTGPVDQVRIYLAHSYAQLGQPGDCIDSVNRFVQQHPHHREMGQMLMLRGECHQQLGRAPNAADSAGSALRLAIRDFDFVATRLTNNPLQEAAQNRADALRQQLARAELQAAENHLKAGEYAAAANRSRYLMENFQKTPQIAGALEVLAAAYEGLGLHDRAASTRAVLSSNYPAGRRFDADIPALPQLATTAETSPAKVTVAAAPVVKAPVSVIETNHPTRSPSVKIPADSSAPAMSAKETIAAAVPNTPTLNMPGPLSAPMTPLAKSTAIAASKPAPKPASKVAPRPEAKPRQEQGWALQVASFKSSDNARELERRLRSAGYPSFILQGEDYDRVLIGYETQLRDIETLRLRLKQRFGFNGLIRHSDDFR